MTAAIFGLIGVVVGAFINGAATALLQRRSEQSDQRSAARLVAGELAGYFMLADAAARQPPENLPQLRKSEPTVWPSQRAALARSLPSEIWELVTLAYAHVDNLVFVLVFEPDGTLEGWRSREATRLLAELREPAKEAADALGELVEVSFEQLYARKEEIVAR
jgi:hypothetical protein